MTRIKKDVFGAVLSACLVASIIQFAYAESIIVRTINVKQDTPDLPIRIEGVADQLYAESSEQLGIFGLQEAAVRLTCNHPRESDQNRDISGEECIAVELERLFLNQVIQSRFGGRTNIGNGAIVDGSWKVLSSRKWQFGYRWWKPSTYLGSGRFIQEVKLQHESLGIVVRFYNTHFSSGASDKQVRKRQYQANWASNKILERFLAGEMPPILVGDFNTEGCPQSENPERAIDTLDRRFSRPRDLYLAPGECTRIDMIFVGNSTAFPQARGAYAAIRPLTIELSGIDRVEGYPNYQGQLSDHASVGIELDMGVEPIALGVTLYQHDDSTGENSLFVTTSYRDLVETRIEDDTSAVALFGNTLAIAYEKDDYAGRALYIWRNMSQQDLKARGFHDNISSIELFNEPLSGITVYRKRFFEGNSTFISSDIANTKSIGFGDNIQSIEVHGNTTAIVYNQSGHRTDKEWRVVSESVADLRTIGINRKISSIKFE